MLIGCDAYQQSVYYVGFCHLTRVTQSASHWILPAAAWYVPFFVVRFRAASAKTNNDRKKSTALPQALIASDTRPRNCCHLNDKASPERCLIRTGV
jgi:hypothetical protein